jgi:hypothetical protein
MKILVGGAARRPSTRLLALRLSSFQRNGNNYAREHYQSLQAEFLQIDALVCQNVASVQHAFARAEKSRESLHGMSICRLLSGWNALDCALADIMGTESAFCRLNMMSGTVRMTPLHFLQIPICLSQRTPLNITRLQHHTNHLEGLHSKKG